jgi:hypothetical protein
MIVNCYYGLQANCFTLIVKRNIQRLYYFEYGITLAVPMTYVNKPVR